eukprot:gene38851-47976_t
MLAGKSCIVTGSTAGIGKGIAKSFLKEGAFVFINGRSSQSVTAALESAESFFSQVEASGREVDVLVNNMGIFEINIARGLAELTKGTNVTVNSLLPGPTATEGLTTFVQGIAEKSGTNEAEAISAYFSEREPTSLLQRFLTVEEVSNVALFLASDLSSGINGAAQKVEGGIVRSI